MLAWCRETPIAPVPSCRVRNTIKDAFQKKVRNERRDRRAARKRAARVAASLSIVEHQPTDTVQ